MHFRQKFRQVCLVYWLSVNKFIAKKYQYHGFGSTLVITCYCRLTKYLKCQKLQNKLDMDISGKTQFSSMVKKGYRVPVSPHDDDLASLQAFGVCHLNKDNTFHKGRAILD